jgi:hypothetical protein
MSEVDACVQDTVSQMSSEVAAFFLTQVVAIPLVAQVVAIPLVSFHISFEHLAECFVS